MTHADIAYWMIVGVTIVIILMIAAWLFWPPRREDREPIENDPDGSGFE